MKNLNNLIQNVVIFKDLSQAQLEEILKLGKIANFQEGDVIFHYGEKNKNIYIILEGRVKAALPNNNMQDIIIEIIEEKNIIGSINFFNNDSPCANVIALTDMTLFLICETDFRSILEKYPVVSINLLKDWARRIHLANVRIQNNSSCSLKKTVNVILEFAENQGKLKSGEILLPNLKHHEWASYADLSRETFTRCLSKLKKEGLIINQPNNPKQLLIKNIDKLRFFLKET